VREWDDYIGQEVLKARLNVSIEAANKDERHLDHILFAAPPGFGKSSLAHIVASRSGLECIEVQMPLQIKELAWIVGESIDCFILLDEIHAAPKATQEALLPALQQGYLQLPNGRTEETRHVTFIGATTEPDKLIKPLWDRFMIKPRFEEYSDGEMQRIIVNMARRCGIELGHKTARALALASAGTPRLAGNLVIAARDLATTGQEPTSATVLHQTGIDCDGLSERHMDYLSTLRELRNTSGLRNICSMMQISQSMAEELERLLIKRGLITLDPQGRSLTSNGVRKITGMTRPPRKVE
jgi:Holliday junction DNA helicase RuvB